MPSYQGRAMQPRRPAHGEPGPGLLRLVFLASGTLLAIGLLAIYLIALALSLALPAVSRSTTA